MPKYKVYLYETAAGVKVVENVLLGLAKSSYESFNAIQTGLEVLAEYGPDTGLNKFKRLKYVEGAFALWELRATARPAYRALLASVPGEDAFVILHVVPKTEMERKPQQYINQALDHYDHWMETRENNNE